MLKTAGRVMMRAQSQQRNVSPTAAKLLTRDEAWCIAFEVSEKRHVLMVARGPGSHLAASHAIYSLIVLTTLDSGRVLLVAEYLSCARTMSSYFEMVVTGCFGTICTTL